MNLHDRPSKTQIVHKFLALFWYVCLLRLVISAHVYFAKNVANSILPFNSWLSFQRCVVFYGDNPYVASSASLREKREANGVNDTIIHFVRNFAKLHLLLLSSRLHV